MGIGRTVHAFASRACASKPHPTLWETKQTERGKPYVGQGVLGVVLDVAAVVRHRHGGAVKVESVCGLDRPAARRRREICPRRRAPAVFTGEKRRLALAACLFLRISATRLSTIFVWCPVEKTCKSNKPPLSDTQAHPGVSSFPREGKKTLHDPVEAHTPSRASARRGLPQTHSAAMPRDMTGA